MLTGVPETNGITSVDGLNWVWDVHHVLLPAEYSELVLAAAYHYLYCSITWNIRIQLHKHYNPITISFMLSNAQFIKEDKKKKRRKEKSLLTRGEFQQWAGWGNTATLLWGLHTLLLKKKHIKGFLGFQIPKQREDSKTQIQRINILIKKETLEVLPVKGDRIFFPEIESTWDYQQRKRWCLSFFT